MAININDLTSSLVGSNKSQKNSSANRTDNANGQNGTDNAGNEDRVELSDQARVLKAAESRIQDLPDIDQAKVDRIRNAITNGEYEIDYDKLAAAFRRFESEL